MARPATGQVLTRRGKQGIVFSLRFRAGGRRQCVTLGRRSDGWTQAKAEQELADTLTLVRKGLWQPPVRSVSLTSTDDPSFHLFASEWMESKRSEGLSARTVVDYE